MDFLFWFLILTGKYFYGYERDENILITCNVKNKFQVINCIIILFIKLDDLLDLEALVMKCGFDTR